MKGVLFFGGLAIAVFWAVLFALSFMGMTAASMALITLIAVAATTPMSIALLMHAKDVRESKQGLSMFCRGLAIFWIVVGGLNLIGVTVVSLIFG